MRLEIVIDGQVAAVPPRREEMIRQLLRADLDVDTMQVGAVEFRLSHEKVVLLVTKSYAPVRVLRWAEWLRAAVASVGM
jgi:hypothetical protein